MNGPQTKTDDPMIAVAANKTPVSLADGRTGFLVWWQFDGDRCTVVINGRHERVKKDSVTTVLAA